MYDCASNQADAVLADAGTATALGGVIVLQAVLREYGMFEGRDEHLDAVDHACFQIIHMAKPIRAAQAAKRDLEEAERNYKTLCYRLGNRIMG